MTAPNSPSRFNRFSKAECILVVITMIWGGTFLLVQHAMTVSGPMFFVGLRSVGPSDASIVMNLEPVLTVVLSILLLGESFGWLQALGGGVILGGLYLLRKGESVHESVS